MTADGIVERRNTVTRVESLGVVVHVGEAPDNWEPPRDASNRVLPYVILDFGAPIRTVQDRSIGLSEQEQPHLLTVNAACISGVRSWSEDLMKAVFAILVDWRPSESADPFTAQGGYGTRLAASGNVPSRPVEGLYLETSVNQSLPEN